MGIMIEKRTRLPKNMRQKKIPKNKLATYNKIISVLKKLENENEIREWKTHGFSPISENVFVFSFYFLHWSREITLYVYLKEGSNVNEEISLIKNYEKKIVHLVVSKTMSSDSMYQQLKVETEIANTGGNFEKKIVAEVNDFWKRQNQSYRLEKSLPDEDEDDKVDIWFWDGLKKVGIQIKTSEQYWNGHRSKYPDVPSLLCPLHLYNVEAIALRLVKISKEYPKKVLHISMDGKALQL